MYLTRLKLIFITDVHTSSEHAKPKTKLTLTLPALKRRTSAVEEEDEDADLDYAPGCERAETTTKKAWLCSVDLVIQQLYITTV